MAEGAEEEGVDVVFSDPCSATRLTGAGEAMPRKLRINAKETMRIAEKLYTQG